MDGGDPGERGEVVSFWGHPALGWAAAACLGLALIVLELLPMVPTGSLADARQALLESRSAVRLDFAGTEGFSEFSGDVVWGDEQQAGFMKLSGLPKNDPGVSQYQLWIVDPERDSAPVDGGVFDIPADGGFTIVPIDAALDVTKPVAFVITVEKPGGVVVSKQETVAAVAQQAS